MALEASDRIIYIIWVNWRCTCGWIWRPTFKLSASLLDIMGKWKEISQDRRKTIVEITQTGYGQHTLVRWALVVCSPLFLFDPDVTGGWTTLSGPDRLVYRDSEPGSFGAGPCPYRWRGGWLFVTYFPCVLSCLMLPWNTWFETLVATDGWVI
jgi:hypothetical protein